MTTRSGTLPDKKELRQFGLMMAGLIALVFGLLLPWLWGASAFPRWPWIVAAVFAVPALVFPHLLAPVFSVWMKLAHVLGWINTRIILFIVFVVLIVPLGLLFKLINRDAMARNMHSKLDTWRIKSKPVTSKNLKRPF